MDKEHLHGVESTFDALFGGIHREWYQQDDVIDPFDDRLHIHVATVWTFDIDDDTLRFDKKDKRRKIPLSALRQRPIEISDFEHYKPPVIPSFNSQSVLQPPYWHLRSGGLASPSLQRQKAFVSRMFKDFSYQWRHILQSRYNNSTFRRLARAVIRIATLDFRIIEVTSWRQARDGFLVWIHDLPKWEPYVDDIVRVGRTSVVLSQHLSHAVTLIREDFAKRSPSSSVQSASGAADVGSVYLVLSVKDIVLYWISSESDKYTRPEPFLDGKNAPSSKAIELLLFATQTRVPTTAVQLLPLEIQDMILDKVSDGPIESARVGCLLNFGSNFQWKSGQRLIERQDRHTGRTPWTPVESQIWFGDCFSGIAYK